jgi:hypothetical protein
MNRFHLAYLLMSAAGSLAFGEAVPVKIVPEGGITRGGEPYFIKGAGGTVHLDELMATGGNSIRTWTTNGLGEILDDAARRGLTVCAGIWLEPECSWFSYSNAEHCARQAARVQEEVLKHRYHPALLFWGLGNEAEGDGGNDAYWKQLEVLAKAVKAIDPAHPTFTAVAGLSPQKATGLNAHTPSLDFVGINTYGALHRLREHLVEVKWTRPWVVTEYGPRGFWESPRTAWDAPLEQTSTEKAELIRKAYKRAIEPAGACWGGYVFLWGQKQEATSTWFGIFTESGESTATRDVMHELWKGEPSPDHAPEIKSLTSAAAKKEVAPGTPFAAQAEATDADADPLAWHWSVTAEHAGRDAKGRERVTKPLPEYVIKAEGPTATFKAPTKPGAYRVHLRVTDHRKRAATANFPILVK